MGGAHQRLDKATLAAAALVGKGTVSLAFFLEQLVPVARLRSVAKQHNVTIKGFRIERVPAAKLAATLAEQTQPALDDVCELLVDVLARGNADASDGASTGEASVESETSQKELALARELEIAQRGKARALGAAERARASFEELRATHERELVASAKARAQISHLERELEAVRDTGAEPRSRADHQRRLHDLRREHEALTESEERLRRQIALELTARRDAESRADELETELDEVAPMRRGRRRPRRKIAYEHGRMRVPYFSETFMKSLYAMDRRTVEAAFRAIFVLCTEGPAYPSLEHKKLEGQQELHSIRAGIKVRVYFRYRERGDIDVVEISDREDQDTMLRRLKER